MVSLLEAVRHELDRLHAICRKLSEVKVPAIKDETDQLQVLASKMRRNLDATARQLGEPPIGSRLQRPPFPASRLQRPPSVN